MKNGINDRSLLPSLLDVLAVNSDSAVLGVGVIDIID